MTKEEKFMVKQASLVSIANGTFHESVKTTEQHMMHGNELAKEFHDIMINAWKEATGLPYYVEVVEGSGS